MAEKGIYSPEEQRILDLFHAVAARIGAGEDNRELTVTEYSMLVNARWADVWNPLWNDAEYARKTRWGSLVAFPGYAECVGFSQLYLTCPEGKYLYKRIIGEDWQFYRPIRAGDVLSARHRAPTIEDITGEDGVRRFRSVMNDCSISCGGEPVARYRVLVDYRITDEPEEPPIEAEYAYTEEEYAYMKAVMSSELIRGADMLWYEDAEIGSQLAPASIGTVNSWDCISFNTSRQSLSSACVRYYAKDRDRGILLTDPQTNVEHVFWAANFNNRVAQITGEPRAYQFPEAIRPQFVRLISNWMGDNGFIESLSWRENSVTHYGEAAILSGNVAEKLGDGRVRLDLQASNLAAKVVSDIGSAVVRLPSREKVKEIKRFKIGDRVRIKAGLGRFPAGHPLTGAEGVVVIHEGWQYAFDDYEGYLGVNIDPKTVSIPMSIGNELFIKAEDLEKID